MMRSIIETNWALPTQLLWIGVLCSMPLARAIEQDTPAISYKLTLDFKPAGLTGKVAGSLTIHNWPLQNEQQGRCLFLPLNDPDYFYDPARGLTPTISKYGVAERHPGSIQIKGGIVSAKMLSGHIMKLEEFRNGQEITFFTELPHWDDVYQERWFFADFYPIPLKSCPTETQNTTDYQRDLKSKIELHYDITEGMQIFHPGESKDDSVGFVGSKIGLYLTKSGSVNHVSFQMGDTSLSVIYFSAGFAHLINIITKIVTDANAMLGTAPYPALLFIETEDLEKSLNPGIVTINRERQNEIEDSSKSILNWNVWQIVNFASLQWLGTNIHPLDFKEYWFHKGFADVFSYIFLKKHPELSNLFAVSTGDSPFIQFDYRQAQDLLAATLTFLHPFNALTDKNGLTLGTFEEQHAFSYMRNSLALRYLYWFLGDREFFALVNEFLTQYSQKAAHGQDFLNFLKSKNTQASLQAAKILSQWWSQDSWPDFYLTDTSYNPQSGEAVVYLEQSDDYNFPIDVELTDTRGRRYLQRSEVIKDQAQARFKISSPIDRISINPNREVFDANRFDNTNQGFSLNIFPGAARTFKDDELTLLWLPMFQILPGEPFSLLLATQAFRYVQSSYSTILSLVPSQNRLGLITYFLTDIPKLGLYTISSLIQDYSNTYLGERIIEAGLYRAPFIWKDPNTEVGIRVRSRQTLGQSDSQHQTLTYRLKMIPGNASQCHYEFKVDIEHTPATTKGGFRYQRDLSILRSNCRMLQMDWGVRGFFGSLKSDGTIPDTVAFKPQNVDEARVRIDSPSLDTAHKIQKVGFDLLWSAKLPLPSTMFFLPKESRYRLYYDLARTENPDHTIRAAGGGLLVPVGGDAVGKNSIAVLQLSILGVIYRSIDSQSDGRPGVLVDFLGKL